MLRIIINRINDEDKDIDYLDFTKEIIRLNQNNLENFEVDKTCILAVGENIVIPDGYLYIGEDGEVSYIGREKKEYKLCMRPLNKKGIDDLYSIVVPVSNNQIVTEKESILEKACIYTEFESNKKSKLMDAIQKAKEGDYSLFSNIDNIQKELEKIDPVEISKIMSETLLKKFFIKKSLNSKNVEYTYVKYIKEKLEASKTLKSDGGNIIKFCYKI